MLDGLLRHARLYGGDSTVRSGRGPHRAHKLATTFVPDCSIESLGSALRPPYAGKPPLSARSGDQVTGSEFSAETAREAPVLVRLQSVG